MDPEQQFEGLFSYGTSRQRCVSYLCPTFQGARQISNETMEARLTTCPYHSISITGWVHLLHFFAENDQVF